MDELTRLGNEARKAGRRRRAQEAWKNRVQPERKCMLCEVLLDHNRKFCSVECREIWIRDKKEALDYAPVGTLALGAACEHAVAADLLLRGYDVYSAAYPGALCDLVAICKNSQAVYRVQVRSATVGNEGHLAPTNRSKAPEYDILALVFKGYVEYKPDMPAI